MASKRKPLLPDDPSGRARVRALVQTVCSEIQPLNNLGVTRYLGDELGQGKEQVKRWYAHWVKRGFEWWYLRPYR